MMMLKGGRGQNALSKIAAKQCLGRLMTLADACWHLMTLDDALFKTDKWTNRRMDEWTNKRTVSKQLVQWMWFQLGLDETGVWQFYWLLSDGQTSSSCWNFSWCLHFKLLWTFHPFMRSSILLTHKSWA